MPRATTVCCTLIIAFAPASALIAHDNAEAFNLLSRRNPSLRTGIVSVVRLTTGTGMLNHPATETRRRVQFDRDNGRLRIDQIRNQLEPTDETIVLPTETHAFIRTLETGIILRQHRRTIDIIRPDNMPPLFDPLSVGLIQDAAMDTTGGVSQQLEILREFESQGRLKVSAFDANRNEHAVSFQLAFPQWSTVSELFYWFSADQGNVPVRFVARTLKQLDDGSFQPKGPNETDCSVHWMDFEGAFVPREQTITERVLNPAGEVVGTKDTALAYEWEMVNEDFEDLSVFTVESLDLPKGSHKIVDGRSGEPIVIQDPRIPSAAMLAQLNEEVRRRRAGRHEAGNSRTGDAPAQVQKSRPNFKLGLILANICIVASIAIMFLVRRARLQRKAK